METGEQGLVMQAIGAAVLAGAYRAAIRQDRHLAAGYGKLAEKHSREATRLADEICGAATRSAGAVLFMGNPPQA